MIAIHWELIENYDFNILINGVDMKLIKGRKGVITRCCVNDRIKEAKRPRQITDVSIPKDKKDNMRYYREIAKYQRLTIELQKNM